MADKFHRIVLNAANLPAEDSSESVKFVWLDVGLILCQHPGRNSAHERLGVIKWDVWEIRDLMETLSEPLSNARGP